MKYNNLSLTKKVAHARCMRIHVQLINDQWSNDSWVRHCALRRNELHNRLNEFVQDYRGIKTYLAKRQIAIQYGWMA